jgi:hypothetical protein
MLQKKQPDSLRDKVKREIEQMEKLNIIRRVDEPTEWINSMVVVPKPNGEVRICLDPRDLNFAVKREHCQMPTLDETTSQLASAKYFTVLQSVTKQFGQNSKGAYIYNIIDPPHPPFNVACGNTCAKCSLPATQHCLGWGREG